MTNAWFEGSLLSLLALGETIYFGQSEYGSFLIVRLRCECHALLASVSVFALLALAVPTLKRAGVNLLASHPLSLSYPFMPVFLRFDDNLQSNLTLSGHGLLSPQLRNCH